MINGSNPKVGLNNALGRSRASFFLPVAMGDWLCCRGLQEMAQCLNADPESVVAAGNVLCRESDGSIQAVPSASALLLFNRQKLAAAGGWGAGECCWADRSRRHFPLLTRLARYRITTCDSLVALLAPEFGGEMISLKEARQFLKQRADTVKQKPDPVKQKSLSCTDLSPFLFDQIRLEPAGLSGRLAGLQQDLAVLAQGPIHLVRLSTIEAVVAPNF